jgi:hypothetical protein
LFLGKTVDVDALPATFKIQYSEVGKNNWQDLIEMRRPNTTARTYKVREKILMTSGLVQMVESHGLINN